MRHPNVEIMLSSMMGKLTGYCKCQGGKVKLKVDVALGGAGLVAERSPSGARADGARRCQTARAWPRAAQHKLVADFNRVTVFFILFFTTFN